jgi:ESCRT-II complex subunit VPS22
LYAYLLVQEQYKNVGEEVRKNNLEAMKEQMAIFKAKLEEFALKHKSDIRKDPQFRARFHQMCANIGVDPLASNKASSCAQSWTSLWVWVAARASVLNNSAQLVLSLVQGIWTKALGLGDFYYELGVQVCMCTRAARVLKAALAAKAAVAIAAVAGLHTN